jgi:hypothetical protein
MYILVDIFTAVDRSRMLSDCLDTALPFGLIIVIMSVLIYGFESRFESTDVEGFREVGEETRYFTAVLSGLE